MAVLTHPLSGAVYSLLEEGLVRVENNGLEGVFTHEGRHVSGDLTHVDMHMALWLAGPALPAEDAIRRNR